MATFKAVIATTVLYSKMDGLRADLAIKTAQEARRLNLGMVAVDGGSTDYVTRCLREAGAIVVVQGKPGMGYSRRQALYLASAGFEKFQGLPVIWMEPEKHTLLTVANVKAMLGPIENNEADLVLPARATLASYPPEQMYAELLGNQIWHYLTGRPLDDPWFGLRVMSAKALPYFINYDGKERGHEDKWDSIFVPVIDALKAGLRVLTAEVDYHHPHEQTAAETGDVDMLLKRIEQLSSLVPTLRKEAVGLTKK